MKGLLYKDFILNLLNIVCMGIVVVGLSAYMMFVLHDGGQDDVLSVYITLFTGIVALNFALPMFAVDGTFADAKTKWSSFAMALPGGYKQMVAAKYLLGILGHVLAIVCSFMMIWVCKLTSGVEIQTMAFVLVILFMTGLMLIVQSLFLPFALKSNVGVVKALSLCFAAVLFYGLLCYLAFGNLSFFGGGDLEERLIQWFTAQKHTLSGICFGVAGVGILSESVSYLITKKTFLN